MDLDEYVFFKKKNDKSFTDKKFAEMLGITRDHFYRLKTGNRSPSGKVAYLIDKVTEKKVDVMEMIRRFYEKTP